MAQPRGANSILSWLQAFAPLGRAGVDAHTDADMARTEAVRYAERPVQGVLAGDCLRDEGVDCVVHALVAHIPDELSIQTFVCLRCFTQLALDERGARNGDVVRCPVCDFTIEVQMAFFLSRILMRSRESVYGEYSGYSECDEYGDGWAPENAPIQYQDYDATS